MQAAAAAAAGGRNAGYQSTHPVLPPGGNLFSWGLAEARLGRRAGDVDSGDASVPEVALSSLSVRGNESALRGGVEA
eukprot:358495-Chlamydomonas_euryale.AAC.1